MEPHGGRARRRGPFALTLRRASGSSRAPPATGAGAQRGLSVHWRRAERVDSVDAIDDIERFFVLSANPDASVRRPTSARSRYTS